MKLNNFGTNSTSQQVQVVFSKVMNNNNNNNNNNHSQPQQQETTCSGLCPTVLLTTTCRFFAKGAGCKAATKTQRGQKGLCPRGPNPKDPTNHSSQGLEPKPLGSRPNGGWKINKMP